MTEPELPPLEAARNSELSLSGAKIAEKGVEEHAIGGGIIDAGFAWTLI
jgi:hypothetical protein